MPGIKLAIGLEESTAGPLNVWTPLALGTKLKLWVQDDTLATDTSGGVVTTWRDKSNNNNSPTQATSSKKPAGNLSGGANGRGYIRTDGVDDFLRVAFPLTQPWFRLSVLRTVTASAFSDTLLDGASGNTGRLFDNGGSGSPRTLQSYAGGAAIPGDPQTSRDWTQWALLEEQYNGASSKHRVNGGSYTTGNAGTNNAGGLTIGIFGDQTSAPTDMDCSLVLICDSLPTDAEIAALTAFYRSYYAL